MSDVTIIGPDGSRFVFPAGTSREVMLNAMRRRYTGQERREREQTRDMILNSQLPGPGRAGVQEYLSRNQMRQDLAQARESNIAAQEAALIPEDTTRERFYTGAQGVTLGAAPLIQGATVAPMAALLYPFLTDDMRAGRSLGEFVSDMSGGAYQRARTDIARAREERPIESLALETAGGLFTGKTAYDKLGERFLQSRAAARGGVVGTGAGAQYGFLESEGSPEETAIATMAGGIGGAGIAKALQATAGPVGRMFNRMTGRQVEPEPVMEPSGTGAGYFGRQSMRAARDRGPSERVLAMQADWAPVQPNIGNARAAANAAGRLAQEATTLRGADRQTTIERASNAIQAVRRQVQDIQAQRAGMATPEDQRLQDIIDLLEPTSDPVQLQAQATMVQQNLARINQAIGVEEVPRSMPPQQSAARRLGFQPTVRDETAVARERPIAGRYAGARDDIQSMGFGASAPKTPQQAVRFETPGSPEYEAAVAKGLDMSTEARMARAKEMGFDTETVLYHGTKSNFSAFDLGKGVSTEAGLGIHLGDSSQAEDIVRTRGVEAFRSGDLFSQNSQILPVYIKGKNFLRLRDDESWTIPQLEYQLATLDKPITIPWKDRFNKTMGELRQALEKEGYDGIVYANKFEGKVDGIPSNKDSYIIFDPKNIRSVHAAFDPEKSGSSELLAAVPFAVGGAGLGMGAMQEEE